MPVKIDRQEPIEKLRERHERLNERKITAAADLKNAEEQLSRLQQEAREQFGTDDLAQLQQQLEALTRDNERLRADYQQHLETIETELSAVEADFGEKSK